MESEFVRPAQTDAMSKCLRISVVTINLNNARGLRRTLASAAEQQAHLPDNVILEHIVVDGQSTDDSLSWTNSDFVSDIVIAPANGVYNAVNIGLRHATGDVVGLLHAGDVYTNTEVLSIIASRFESDSNLDYLWGDVVIGRRYYRGRTLNVKQLTMGFAPPHPSLYMRRKLLDTVGYYDETYKNAADFDYFVRIALHPSLYGVYIPGAMVDMESGGRSHSLRSRLFTNNHERLTSLRSHGLSTSHLKLLLNYKNVIFGYLTRHRDIH